MVWPHRGLKPGSDNTNITTEAHVPAARLRGLAITLRMRKTIFPGQWQPWTAVSPLLGLISMV